MQYLYPQDKKYLAVPQVQVLREMLASVTVTPEQIGVPCVGGEGINTNSDLCKIETTGYECVNKQCIQPNAWFHWAYKVDDASGWSAATTVINYKVTVPDTRTPAVQVYRRADVGVEGLMLLVGLMFTVVAVVGTKWVVKHNDKFQLITEGSL